MCGLPPRPATIPWEAAHERRRDRPGYRQRGDGVPVPSWSRRSWGRPSLPRRRVRRATARSMWRCTATPKRTRSSIWTTGVFPPRAEIGVIIEFQYRANAAMDEVLAGPEYWERERHRRESRSHSGGFCGNPLHPGCLRRREMNCERQLKSRDMTRRIRYAALLGALFLAAACQREEWPADGECRRRTVM